MSKRVDLHRQCNEDNGLLEKELHISVKELIFVFVLVLLFGIIVFVAVPVTNII